MDTKDHGDEITVEEKTVNDEIDKDSLEKPPSVATVEKNIIDPNPSDNKYDFSIQTGNVNLAFPEHPKYGEKFCFPPSYYTITSKEKLLFYFAENFRVQFKDKYPQRRPLVLVVKNECEVEKFVSTTIRPTAFSNTKLIGSIETCANFVAAFIIYEPLPNPIALPERLMSPSTLLKNRRGNSFEMATLLCSLLIGAGYPAMICSGTARHETTLNDQRDVICPFIPKREAEYPIDEIFTTKDDNIKKEKYTLSPPPDLRSHLDDILNEMALKKQLEADKIKSDEEKLIEDFLGTQSTDKFHNRRSHAWIVIIENAQWSLKKREKIINEDGDEIDAPPRAYFIEPSTGFIHDVYSKYYIHVESIWHQYNYYVNLQLCRPRDIDWDLTKVENWEHFLPGEPPETRIQHISSEDNAAELDLNEIYLQKHLDMIRTWVTKLEISENDLTNPYPNDEKIIHFNKCIYEKYNSYSRINGKETQITVYADKLYETPNIRWEFFENREDFLQKTKIFFLTKNVEESFFKGRDDSLKFYEHSIDLSRPKRFSFYHLPRLDSLYLMEVFQGRIIYQYFNRFDLLYYEEYNYRFKDFILEKVTQKFRRNPNIPHNKDVALRKLYLEQKKIYLRFHYGKGALTFSTREFIEPPRPAYGHEITFNPSLTKGYIADPTEPKPTQLELYNLLKVELKLKEEVQKKFDEHLKELNNILVQRQQEMKNVLLKFRIFDSLHNEAARKIRLHKFEQEEKRLSEVALQDADFLGPYLVVYHGRVLNKIESQKAFDACLYDLKTNFVQLLNTLQSRYEDLTSECKALKVFIRKFHSSFDNFDYERLIADFNQLELKKRMVQQRLEMTHEEAQRKYQKVKLSLENDKRLNFND